MWLNFSQLTSLLFHFHLDEMISNIQYSMSVFSSSFLLDVYVQRKTLLIWFRWFKMRHFCRRWKGKSNYNSQPFLIMECLLVLFFFYIFIRFSRMATFRTSSIHLRKRNFNIKLWNVQMKLIYNCWENIKMALMPSSTKYLLSVNEKLSEFVEFISNDNYLEKVETNVLYLL